MKIGFSQSKAQVEKLEKEFEEKEELVRDQVKKHFKPEFLSRLDRTIIFKPLQEESIEAIVRIHLQELQERIAEKKIKIECAPAAIKLLAKKSFNQKNGARLVRRVLQEEIENKIAEEILSRKGGSFDCLKIDASSKSLQITTHVKEKAESWLQDFSKLKMKPDAGSSPAWQKLSPRNFPEENIRGLETGGKHSSGKWWTRRRKSSFQSADFRRQTFRQVRKIGV